MSPPLNRSSRVCRPLPVLTPLVLLAAGLWAGAAEAQRIELEPVETFSLVTESRGGKFGFCEPPLIDRSPPFPNFLTSGDPRLTPERAMAGFFNHYRPGADPFPCNHFTVRSWAGVLRFGLDVSPDRGLWIDRPFTLVALELEETLPVRGEGVINRSPSCPGGFGTGCLRTTRASCRFRVGLFSGATTPLRPTDPDSAEERRPLRPFFPATLESRPRAFEVSGTGERRRTITIDVTREFRRAVRQGRDLRFVVFPDDAGVGTDDFGNDCRVLFGGRLIGGVSGSG
ncbi:MAG: hypothetical protein ACK41W_06455 [Cyanobacteriota bacterium]|jgi:hypothetical protein